MVTIGDSPPGSLSFLVYLVPLLYYSHIAHRPHTHHNLLLPFLSVERDKNSTSHLCRGVQFRVSLMVKEYFHSACRGAIFCVCLSKPRPPSCFHALVDKMALGGGSSGSSGSSGNRKWHCYKGCGAGRAEGRAMGLL